MTMSFGNQRVSRRQFLEGLSVLTASAALPNVLFAKTGSASRLIVVILRGALDGLAAAPPYGDPNYAPLHRDLAIAAPSQAGGALALDGTFGLHPSLAFLHERYQAGELLVFHAIASPYRDRSHFDGQNVLENGLTQTLGSSDGWLNRALNCMPPRISGPDAGRAIALSQNVPLILRGTREVLSKSPQTTPDIDEDLMARLADLYSKDPWFSARLSEAGESEKLAAGGDGSSMLEKSGNPRRRDGRLERTVQMAAQIMRGGEGPEIAVLEASGWDTHANQGAAQGTLAGRLNGLDQAMRVLAGELGPLWQNTAVLIVTEFGRTAAMNGSRGTDHGTGTCCFALGGAIAGGRIVADWPGLARTDLLEGRDLKPTADLRSLFKGVLADHLRIDRARLDQSVFPDSAKARPFSGLIKT
jgi:uncharacterized protein (DUF1501 family)